MNCSFETMLNKFNQAITPDHRNSMDEVLRLLLVHNKEEARTIWDRCENENEFYTELKNSHNPCFIAADIVLDHCTIWYQFNRYD